MFENLQRTLIISLYDISKFFDRESLVDVLGEAYKCGIRGKLYRLLYEMNKDSIIKVRTGVGDTETRETGEGLGQGTIEEALLSAANLDQGVQEQFKDSTEEVYYGKSRLQPMLFQDDVIRCATTVEAAQDGNKKM